MGLLLSVDMVITVPYARTWITPNQKQTNKQTNKTKTKKQNKNKNKQTKKNKTKTFNEMFKVVRFYLV